MSNVVILHALQKHNSFIIKANNLINNTNETEQTNNLIENIDKDLFTDNPKFECLIAEIDGEAVGMIENKDIHIISCATGNENERMNKILKGYGAKRIDLDFYYKKI